MEGHQWPLEPGRIGADMLSSVQVGGLEALTIRIAFGAGGRTSVPGDYLYGDHREPYREAGLWGIFRVYPAGADVNTLVPLRKLRNSNVSENLHQNRQIEYEKRN